MNPIEWEQEAASVLRDLSELQQSAPLDVSGYLQDAESNVTHALTRYRENRQGEEK